MTKPIDINTLEIDYEKLTKEMLQELMPQEPFNYKTKKPEMLDKLDGYISNDPLMKRRILKDFGKQFTIHPVNLDNFVPGGITKTERKRWEEEGKLVVLEHDSFNKYGKTFYVPLYSLESVALVAENAEVWRNEHKEQVKVKRQAAGKKAAETKKENDKARNHFLKEEVKKLLLKWQIEESPAFEVTASMAMWLTQANRWAKTYQEKQFKAIKHEQKYKQRKEELYQLKNEVVQMLSYSPFTSLSVYIPKPHEERILRSFQLCDEHYYMWKDIRESMSYFYSKLEFAEDHYKHHIKKCQECMQGIGESIEYYTLLFLEVKNKDGERVFSFHSPLPVVLEKNLFSHVDINELPEVQHFEQEGMFRFGRGLTEDEKVLYAEKTTMKQLELAILKYKEYLNHWQQAK